MNLKKFIFFKKWLNYVIFKINNKKILCLKNQELLFFLFDKGENIKITIFFLLFWRKPTKSFLWFNCFFVKSYICFKSFIFFVGERKIFWRKNAGKFLLFLTIIILLRKIVYLNIYKYFTTPVDHDSPPTPVIYVFRPPSRSLGRFFNLSRPKVSKRLNDAHE